jgi:hypothetical protein
LFNFACAAFLLGATVFQGMAFCLCPSVDTGRAECPCQGCDDGEKAEQQPAGDAVLAASPHACAHLALDVLQLAEQTAKIDAVSQTPVSTFYFSSVKTMCLVNVMPRDCPRPPLFVTLQRQLC